MELGQFMARLKEEKERRLAEDPVRREYCVAFLASEFNTILFDGLSNEELDEVFAEAKARLRTRDALVLDDDLRAAEEKSNEQFFGQ